MLVDDFFYVVRLNMGIPDSVRINHYQRAVSALVEASGLVNADFLFQSEVAYFFSEFIENRFCALSRAGFSAHADENMFLEDSHRFYSLIESDSGDPTWDQAVSAVGEACVASIVAGGELIIFQAGLAEGMVRLGAPPAAALGFKRRKPCFNGTESSYQ